MKGTVRRGLFWQVYLTLLGSLLLLSILGAVIAHLLMGPPPGMTMRMHLRAPGMHALQVLLAIAAVVALAAYPVMARITRRLESLRGTVESWGAGEMGRRARVDGRDEIASVAATFNTAADRVDALLAAHRGLLVNASHELRSPLARLAIASEMVADSADPALSLRIRTEIAELDALVGEILLSSRLDNVAEIDAVERVDLLALAAEEAARAGIVLRRVPEGQVGFDVDGSPRLLRRLIRNLIDNALKHGASPVEVSLVPAGVGENTRVLVAVHDHGPGIVQELRDKVFEPFFRPAGWSEEAGGWGLGLSLVRQIARRHGGSARVEMHDGVTSFIVALPAAS